MKLLGKLTSELIEHLEQEGAARFFGKYVLVLRGHLAAVALKLDRAGYPVWCLPHQQSEPAFRC